CGSIAKASRGLIPKNPGSNSAASYTNPPAPAPPSSPQSRSAGNTDPASVPETTSSHNCSGVATPPGNRQLIPTIAIGSSDAARTTKPAGAAAPASSPRNHDASTAAVG